VKTSKPMSGVELLDEAKRLITGDRLKDYGSALVNHTRISSLWSAFLGVTISPREAAIMMSLVKIAREAEGPKEDSIVDIAGYAAVCADIAREEWELDISTRVPSGGIVWDDRVGKHEVLLVNLGAGDDDMPLVGTHVD
jgi:hypothetical protein